MTATATKAKIETVGVPMAVVHYKHTLRHQWMCVQANCDGYHHWWRTIR